MNVDLIIYDAAELVTCASGGRAKKGAAMRDAGVVRNAAVAVKGGLVEAVGPTREILGRYTATEEIDAGGRTVAPGFVESHTHIVYAGDRLDEFEMKIGGADYLEILKAGGGIHSTVRKTRAASVSELVSAAESRLEKMMRLGVTTCEIKTGYGLDAAAEFRMLDAIDRLARLQPVTLVPTFLPAHAVPFADYRSLDPKLTDDEIADRYTDAICGEMIPALAGRRTDGSPFFVDVFCERGAFDLERSRRVLEAARAAGLDIKAHVDEFTNLGGSRMCIGLGATSIDHLDAISDDEIALLAESDTVGVITPTVNFNFGSAEFAPARKLIDAGCAVAVSTDYNPGSAPCPSLPNAMAIACRYQKLLPAEAFNAATVNGAFAVGLGTRTGSIEAGKWADFVIFDTADYREVVYEFGGNLVRTVVKRGRAVVG